MKILSITAQKPHSTGSGTYMTELVRSWSAAGHEQAVVCGIYPDDTTDFPAGVACYPVFFTDTERGIRPEPSLVCPCKTKRYELPALPFPIVGMSDIMPYRSTRYRDLTPEMVSEFEDAFISAVSRAAADLDPDLIVCHHLFLLTALVRKHFPERRIFAVSHGTDLRQMINCDNLREIVRPYIAGLDLALALHEEQRGRIISMFGFDENRVRVIGSGYSSRIFNTEGRSACCETDPVRICYAGKISRPKGVPELLAALEQLASDPAVPPFELTMAGGCQDEALKPVLDELPSYIQWLGQIPQPVLAEILRTSDIFVLPSYFEGLPLVLIEAMASGAVPVSTDLPGVREWIDANVTRPSVRYVAMPEMKSVDEPTSEGRSFFTVRLRDCLASAVRDISRSGVPEGAEAPDTSGITWDSVAERLLSFAGVDKS